MIECGSGGWQTEELPWYKEGLVVFFEKYQRLEDANWFALVGAQVDEDQGLFLNGANQGSFMATRDVDLYLFANDMKFKYGNNDGSLRVTITRTA